MKRRLFVLLVPVFIYHYVPSAQDCQFSNKLWLVEGSGDAAVVRIFSLLLDGVFSTVHQRHAAHAVISKCDSFTLNINSDLADVILESTASLCSPFPCHSLPASGYLDLLDELFPEMLPLHASSTIVSMLRDRLPGITISSGFEHDLIQADSFFHHYNTCSGWMWSPMDKLSLLASQPECLSGEWFAYRIGRLLAYETWRYALRGSGDCWSASNVSLTFSVPMLARLMQSAFRGALLGASYFRLHPELSCLRPGARCLPAHIAGFAIVAVVAAYYWPGPLDFSPGSQY
ncbi:MAG TPA: hypothetical protein PKE63_02080 [Lacibacter sp.]|nr:hypothetical protein [Lacibacter sp.]HMO87590.1 hypothetical protein [Lacibacter sp.]HMP86033.1 hypothetical protein [Lacibacter sp.]